MLRAEGIRIQYGHKIVVSSLTVTIGSGRIIAIVGPNGSGKSTMLRCLAGALRPAAGTVTLQGANVYRMSARQASQRLSYVPQDTAMPFAFTVEELVTLTGNGNRAPEAAAAAMALMDLEPLAKSALNSLSGGEQQRATIARGLAQGADCLLLDEPTAHLDLRHQYALFRYLRQYAANTGATVVVVLHDLVLAARYAQDILLMHNGAIAAFGTASDVLQEKLLKDVYDVPLTIRRSDNRVVGIEPPDDLTFS